ncbi:hypothetical protein [[Kitasatospora] papulosa]|uniref:hypothetical protein n=1 Tax=[Kitasatospora] papulosa TaxID=1464011 RepID=UPI0036946E80
MLWFFEGRAQGRIYHEVEPAVLQEAEAKQLLRAELFFVSESMAILAREAAKTLPPFQLFPEDLPSKCGFAFIGGGTFQAVDEVNGCSAFLWEERDNKVHFGLYADTDAMLRTMTASGSCTPEQAADHWQRAGRLTPMGFEAVLPFGANEEVPEEDGGGQGPLLAALRSMWLLMHQPLTEVVTVEPERSAATRLRKAGREPAAVRVIELRRPKNAGGASGDSNREYHHQWIVRGHWRQQWYPARQVHRPVWIAPHVKGPDGAPMIGGEKVYSLK